MHWNRSIVLTLILSVFLWPPHEAAHAAEEAPSALVRTVHPKVAVSPQQRYFLDALADRPTTERIREARVNVDALRAGTADLVFLNLFNDVSYVAERSRLHRRSDREFTWFGQVPGVGWSVLVVRGDRVTGSLHTLDGSYALIPVGGNLHAVLEIDTAGFLPDHPPVDPLLEPIAVSERRTETPDEVGSSACLGDGNAFAAPHGAVGTRAGGCLPVISLLVAHTSDAAEEFAFLEDLILWAVEEANDAYENSSAGVRIELVGVYEVDYSASPSSKWDLENLAGGEAGLDVVHTERERTLADLTILVASSADACGIAYVDAGPDEAFGVVNPACMLPGRFTFAHEIGHLQGARHDEGNSHTSRGYPYGHGYKHHHWRTIMAYDCDPSCPRIPHFSNPAVLFDGEPTGSLGKSENARVLSETARSLRDFRLSCSPEGGEAQRARRSRGAPVRLYEAAPDQLFVVVNHRVLLKVKGTGGSGQNMFALKSVGVDFVSSAGYDYLIGSQVFPAPIRAVETHQGFTFVALSDGRIVKVRGTGGSGRNMFGIEVDSGGFRGVAGYDYYVGSDRFRSPIRHLESGPGVLLVTFDDGRMLKIRGAGGGGFNLFAVHDTGDAFESVAGYHYYLGDQRFRARVSAILVRGNETIIGLANGTMLKVRGTGGSGHNMFAVREMRSGFSGLPGYRYYLGDARFRSAVTLLEMAGDHLLSGFVDGRLLKVRGTGGSGDNMFAVRETRSGFAGLPGYDYYLGDQALPARVTDIVHAHGQTILSLADGRVAKVSGSGGTGHNMLAVLQVPGGFDRVPGYSYLIGSSSFGSAVTQLFHREGVLFVSLANGKVLKARGLGGSGFNLFAVTQTDDGFLGRCCYDYWVGSY